MIHCCRKIILQGVSILLITIFASSTHNSFPCDDFYNNAIKTIRFNDLSRLSVFRTPPPHDHFSFEKTEKVCRLCLDGTLIQSVDPPLIFPYLPLWLGFVNSRPNDTLNLLDNWAWPNGTKLPKLSKHSSIVFPTRVPSDSKSSYAFYAFPNNWIGNDQHFLDSSSNNPKTIIEETDRKISNRRGLKWIVLKQETKLELSMYPISSDYEPQLTLEEEMKLIYSMKYIVCERPYRPLCHYWNFTEQCRMDSKFGCHTYINVMYHNSDDASVQCRPPEHRRIAQRCPISDCTCQVTQWGAWSACGDGVCSAAEQSRRRYRSEVGSACHSSNTHFELMESQACQIHGCDSLLLAAEDLASSTNANAADTDH